MTEVEIINAQLFVIGNLTSRMSGVRHDHKVLQIQDKPAHADTFSGMNAILKDTISDLDDIMQRLGNWQNNTDTTDDTSIRITNPVFAIVKEYKAGTLEID